MRLLNANLHNDPVMLDEAVRVLNELREAWVGILKQEDQDKQRKTIEHQKHVGTGAAVLAGNTQKPMDVHNHIAIKT